MCTILTGSDQDHRRQEEEAPIDTNLWCTILTGSDQDHCGQEKETPKEGAFCECSDWKPEEEASEEYHQQEGGEGQGHVVGGDAG